MAFKIFKIPNQTFIQIYRMKSVRLSWPSIVFLKLEYIIGKFKFSLNRLKKQILGKPIFVSASKGKVILI
jgi:hypothetical protein